MIPPLVSEQVGLKLNSQKTKIMASGPITSWQINGETMETVSDFFGGTSQSLPKVTASIIVKDACSLGKTAMSNIDSILKRRDISLPTNIHIPKVMVFPLVMNGHES